jgi:hypothetical protein
MGDTSEVQNVRGPTLRCWPISWALRDRLSCPHLSPSLGKFHVLILSWRSVTSSRAVIKGVSPQWEQEQTRNKTKLDPIVLPTEYNLSNPPSLVKIKMCAFGLKIRYFKQVLQEALNQAHSCYHGVCAAVQAAHPVPDTSYLLCCLPLAVWLLWLNVSSFSQGQVCEHIPGCLGDAI